MTSKTQLVLPCTHWWLIGPNEGLTSEGICKLCGATQTFQNWFGGTPSWGNGQALVKGRKKSISTFPYGKITEEVV